MINEETQCGSLCMDFGGKKKLENTKKKKKSKMKGTKKSENRKKMKRTKN